MNIYSDHCSGTRRMREATHPLTPLLRPRSRAVLGASERACTVGEQVLRNLRHGGFGRNWELDV